MSEVIHIDLGGELASVAQVLGAATDAILAAPRSTLVFDLGANAVDPNLLGKMWRWIRRNHTLLRARTRTQILVIPKFWHRVQWRLGMMLERPVVRSVIVRSHARASAWLGRQHSA